jgi:hypothetical protein
MPDDEKIFKLGQLQPYDGPSIYHVQQRHARRRVQREWLVENLIPRRCVVILSGWSSVGKTHVLNDLMTSITFGFPFAGHEIMRAGIGCLLFAAEGAEDVIPRWDVIEQAKIRPHLEHEGLPLDGYYPVSWTDEVPRLTAPDAFEQYNKAILRTIAEQRACVGNDYRGLGFIGIDTMAAAADMTDDQHNAVGTNQTVFNNMHRLSKTHDCVVGMVDHLGKDQTRGTRGSGSKEASADVVLRLTGTVTEEGAVSNTAMTIAKLRGAPSGKRFPYSLKPVRMPVVNGRREDGVVVEWSTSLGMHVATQNRRHGALMRALDEAIDEKFQWIRLGRNLNFKGADATLIWEKYKLSYCATVETGEPRDNTIRRSFNRAMKDSSEHGLIAQKTLANKCVVVWRTDYKFPDNSKVS